MWFATVLPTGFEQTGFAPVEGLLVISKILMLNILSLATRLRMAFHGFQDDYIPENGIQRYSGNIKLKYKPIKQIIFTGFLDYTNFQDFKRTKDTNLKSKRLLTYINTEITLTKRVHLYGKYSHNNLSEISERDLNYVGEYRIGEQYNISYFEKNNYKYASSYFDVGLTFKRLLLKGTYLNLKLGHKLNILKYSNKIVTDYQHSRGYFRYSNSKFNPEETEKVIYTSIEVQNNYITVSYLLNRTNYRFGNIILKEDENKSFTNSLISLNVEFIKNKLNIINNLGFKVTYGKLTNYAVITLPIYLNLPPSHQESDWITPYENDNIEFNFYSSFLRNRVDVHFSMYRKLYGKYNHLFEFEIDNIFDIYFENIGEITKKGYELNENSHIIQNNSFEWLMNFSFSKNSSKLKRNEKMMFQIPDTVINNKIVSIINNFRYKNFQLFIEFEGKKGYDINLYKNNITVSEPFSYWERTQISEINNGGVPSSARIKNYERYITDTEYFILKQVGLEYQIRNNKKDNYYIIGLQYNKMRRIYLYLNDIEKYQEQFQKPSFYNAISLSFTMKF